MGLGQCLTRKKETSFQGTITQDLEEKTKSAPQRKLKEEIRKRKNGQEDKDHQDGTSAKGR